MQGEGKSDLSQQPASNRMNKYHFSHTAHLMWETFQTLKQSFEFHSKMQKKTKYIRFRKYTD